MNEKTPTEIAWFAGLYEGEGCLSQDNRNGLWRLSVTMTDEDVVIRAASFMETKVSGPYNPANPKHKKSWRTIAYNQELISEICNMIYPYLGERRKSKIDEARSWLANSKYGFCRKGLHKLSETRTSSGNTTRCHKCKMDYQKEYRRRGKELSNLLSTQN